MKSSYIAILLLFFLSVSCEGDDAREPILVEGAFSSDIFFSEYIEGTSFNKALEIVNLTGETVDLAAEGYSIKKQSNGAGNWMGELLLEGQLRNNEVFVLANEGSGDPTIINSAQLLKTGAPMDFNGNDPIGLFKDGVLIDVIGHLDNPEDFGKDVTLRRTPETIEPSTTYNPEEWELFEVDNVEDLGSY